MKNSQAPISPPSRRCCRWPFRNAGFRLARGIRAGRWLFASGQAATELPDVIPGFEYFAWNGYAVTPHQAPGRRTVETFTKLGIDPVGTTPEQALANVRKDMPLYSRIIDMAGLPRIHH